MNSSLLIFDGGHFHCTLENWCCEEHLNEHVSLYAPSEGRAWVEVDGNRTNLVADRLYMIPPLHRVKYSADPEMIVFRAKVRGSCGSWTA